MCIAIIKEYGVEMPSNGILKRCWRKNSDGAGYAYLTEDDTWRVKKGFMKWKDFLDSFTAEEFKAEHTVIIHFRVGTSGKMIGTKCAPDCTHPFPVSDDPAMLNSLDYTAENIMMHNGVHSRPKGDLSDSQLAVRDIGFPLIPYMDDPKIRDLMARTLHGVYENSNRWFVATGAQYYLVGEWIEDEESKVWYSNDGYRATPEKWMNYGADAVASWMDALRQTPEAAVVNLVGRKAYEYMSGSAWDWNKWKADITTDAAPSTLLIADKHGNINNDIEALYDKDNNVIALVDQNGDMIWDSEPDEDKSNARDEFDNDITICPECQAELIPSEISQHYCPWCYTYIAPKHDDTFECPSCKDTTSIVESSFSVGDSECLRCGAIFLNTFHGEDAIVTWNEDTKAKHDEYIRIIMDGGEREVG